MAHCWSGPCHVHAWGANLLGRGVVRGLLASGTVFESTRACFCEFGQKYIPSSIQRANLSKCNKHNYDLFFSNISRADEQELKSAEFFFYVIIRDEKRASHLHNASLRQLLSF